LGSEEAVSSDRKQLRAVAGSLAGPPPKLVKLQCNLLVVEPDRLDKQDHVWAFRFVNSTTLSSHAVRKQERVTRQHRRGPFGRCDDSLGERGGAGDSASAKRGLPELPRPPTANTPEPAGPDSKAQARRRRSYERELGVTAAAQYAQTRYGQVPQTGRGSSQLAAPVSKLLGSDEISSTHQPERS
jgi:hypothetical protein